MSSASTSSAYTLRLATRLDIPYAAEGARYVAVHPADVTGDGLDDLLAVTLGRGPGEPPAVLLYVAQAHGGFAAPVAYPYADGAYRFSAIADVDGDGRRELVILSDVLEAGTTASGSPTDTTLVMATTPLAAAGLGPFTYRPVTKWASYRLGLGYYEDVASSPVLLDADGDRDLDVAFTTSFTGMGGRYTGFSLELFLHRLGSGDYLDVRWVDVGSRDGGPVPLPLVKGDFTGEGVDDVAVRNVGSNVLRVYSLQTGSLEARQQWLDTDTTSAGAAVVADLDDDGRRDLAFPRLSGERGDVGLVADVASGTQQPPRYFPGLAQTGSTPLIVADADRDRRMDVAQLVATPTGRWNIALHLQVDGGLVLRAPGEFGTAPPTWEGGHLAFGDTNGDQCTDAVVAEGGRIWLLEGQGCLSGPIAPPLGGPLRPERDP